MIFDLSQSHRFGRFDNFTLRKNFENFESLNFSVFYTIKNRFHNSFEKLAKPHQSVPVSCHSSDKTINLIAIDGSNSPLSRSLAHPDVPLPPSLLHARVGPALVPQTVVHGHGRSIYRGPRTAVARRISRGLKIGRRAAPADARNSWRCLDDDVSSREIESFSHCVCQFDVCRSPCDSPLQRESNRLP